MHMPKRSFSFYLFECRMPYRSVLLLLPALAWAVFSCGNEDSQGRQDASEVPDSPSPQEARAEAALQDSRFWNIDDSLETVSMAVCAECHAEVVARYRASPKAHAFQALDSARDNVHAFRYPSRTYADTHRRFQYRYYPQAERLWLEESALEGRPPHRRREPLDYAVGSEENTQTYLHEINGYLYQAPLSITAEGKPHLPAGFSGGHNSRFSRAITAECVSCHNAAPEPMHGSRRRFRHIAKGIHCRSCHGPGAAHVRAMRRGQTVDTAAQADPSIVQPAKLRGRFRDDVCRRCHLVGNGVLREGQSWTDFRPGMKLERVATVFLPAFERPEHRRYMATYFDRMQASACYRGSHKRPAMQGLRCVSCHNPHAEAGAQNRSRYNRICGDCHRPDKPQQIACTEPMAARQERQNDCVACHMPAVKAGNIDLPHTATHDHRIALPGARQRREAPPARDSMPFVSLRTPHVNQPSDETLARAYLSYHEKFAPHKPFLLDSARKYIRRLAHPALDRWMLYYHFLAQQPEKALQTIHRIPDSLFRRAPVSAYQAGQTLVNTGRPLEAVKYYRMAVEQRPEHLDYRLKLGEAWLALRDTARAGRQFRAVQRRQPSLPAVQNHLGFLALLAYDLPTAERHLQRALRLDPDYAPAYLNTAKLHLGKRQWEKARRAIKRALRIRPDYQAAQTLLQRMESR